MRKYNEGYALPFVVVVMLVLCLAVVSILTFSLQNLQNQKASIDHMQDKYEAQGEVEKTIANVASISSVRYDDLSAAKAEIERLLDQEIVSWNNSDSCTFHGSVRRGSVEISYAIILDNIIVQDGDGFRIQKPKISYTNYKISYVEATASIATGEDAP